MVANIASSGRRESTQRVHNARLAYFWRWCAARGLDPYSAPVCQIAEFLSDLGKMCDSLLSLAYATIMGYCPFISAVHNGFGDGPSTFNHQVLHILMKENHGLRIGTDLGLSQGARSLAQGPFELMGRASMRDLWVKLTFLIQLASGRRGGGASKYGYSCPCHHSICLCGDTASRYEQVIHSNSTQKNY